MSDSLFELLEPHFDLDQQHPDSSSQVTNNYLNRLTTLSLSSLSYTEPEALNHDSQSLLRSIQALSKRSYKSIDTSIDALSSLQENIPKVTQDAASLQTALPDLERNAVNFAEKYSKLTENAVLDRRKRVLRLGDNVDRLSDILEMPALLSAAIAASSGSGAASAATSSANASYASALDLYAHIRRFQRLYPNSALVQSIVAQAEDAMRTMTTNLISSLRSPSLKLAGAMRLIGLLRRVAPDLDDQVSSSNAWSSGMNEGSLGAVFLTCRLSTLTSTLEALEPFRDLADQETGQTDTGKEKNAWQAGQQTERYLKRYIEVFREQCFSIISMYKSIFPASLPGPSMEGSRAQDDPSAKSRPLPTRSTSRLRDDEFEMPDDPMQNLPAALSTFSLHIVDLLMDTLKKYMPNVQDRGSRDSLLTQVLYCAASLGRLGADFGMMLSMLEDELEPVPAEPQQEDGMQQSASPKEAEWVQVMKKHRIQAGRLEMLASGAGRQSSKEIPSQG